MTGNVVFIGFAIAGAPGFALVASLVALGGFLVGATVGGLVVDRYGTSRATVLRNAVAVEVVLLAVCLVVSLLVHLREGGPVASTFVAGTAALAMGVQNAAARRIAVPDMTTSVVTMTLTGFAADHLHAAKGAPLRRVLVVLSMFAGALVGAVLVLQVGSHAGLALALVLLIAVSASAAFAGRRPADWQA
jgi:uncharacterized membrane protein YoaK (UPF0700 family)